MLIVIQAFKQANYQIPQKIIDSIPKEERKNLVAYVAAQEGKSYGTRDPHTNSHDNYSWPAKIIKTLQSFFEGVKFFVGHGVNDNSHTGRNPVGKVVKSFVDYVDGKLSNIVIGSFDNKPEEDVVSIEAETIVNPINNVVEGIKKLTGIAMGKSNEVSPAFPGAMKVATIQAFKLAKKQHKEGVIMPEGLMGLEDLKNYIQTHRVLPSAAGFTTVESLEDDRNLWDKVQRRFKDNFKKELDRITEERDNLASKLKEYEGKENLTEGKKLLDKALEKNTTEKQKKYILRVWEKNPTEDFTDKGIEKFIQDSKDDYAELVKEGIFSDSGNGEKEDTPEDLKKKTEKQINEALDADDELDDEVDDDD